MIPSFAHFLELLDSVLPFIFINSGNGFRKCTDVTELRGAFRLWGLAEKYSDLLGKVPKWCEGSSLHLPFLLPEAHLTRGSEWTRTIVLDLSFMLSFCYVHFLNS